MSPKSGYQVIAWNFGPMAAGAQGKARSAALATTARSGDFAKSKAASFETGNACKACPDKCRAD
jgi:hypothetical protein